MDTISRCPYQKTGLPENRRSRSTLPSPSPSGKQLFPRRQAALYLYAFIQPPLHGSLPSNKTPIGHLPQHCRGRRPRRPDLKSDLNGRILGIMPHSIRILSHQGAKPFRGVREAAPNIPFRMRYITLSPITTKTRHLSVPCLLTLRCWRSGFLLPALPCPACGGPPPAGSGACAGSPKCCPGPDPPVHGTA